MGAPSRARPEELVGNPKALWSETGRPQAADTSARRGSTRREESGQWGRRGAARGQRRELSAVGVTRGQDWSAPSWRARGQRRCWRGHTQSPLPRTTPEPPWHPRKEQEGTPASFDPGLRESPKLLRTMADWGPEPERPPGDSETERQRETRSQREASAEERAAAGRERRGRARGSVRAWKSECPAEGGRTRGGEQSQERRGDAARSGGSGPTDPRVRGPESQGRKQHPYLQPKTLERSAPERAR